MRVFLKYATMRSTALRALKVALVITPILTVFNHFAEIRDMKMGAGFWFQVGLTFLVPYGVSTYSSATAAMEEHYKASGDSAPPHSPRRGEAGEQSGRPATTES